MNRRSEKNEYLLHVFPCIGYGAAAGAVTGAAIFLFKLCAKYAERISRAAYAAAKGSLPLTAAVFGGLVLLAFAMLWLHKKVPEVRGGGIPRSEGILRGVLSFRRVKTLLGTFFGSMLSYIGGLPLGTEGPAVLIGTALGGICSKLSKTSGAWNRYVMSGGAGAGFAVATGAPLSGILFALEEIHKRFTPMLVLTVSVAVVAATYVNRLLCAAFSIDPNLFAFESLVRFDLSHAGYLLLYGILIALAVGIFDLSLQWFDRLSAKFGGRNLPASVKLVIAFLLTGILGFVLSDGIYSGHDIIHHLAEHDQTVWMLLLLLLVRGVMMMIMTHAGATGGTFIPTLAIGVLVSALLTKLLIVLGLPAELYVTAMLLGMCVFIGSSLRSPLTGAILFLELTGQFSDLFFVALVVFVANTVTELLNQLSFYDHVLEGLVEKQNEGKTAEIVCFKMCVSDNAFVIGKAIRDIMWPATSVVLSILHADEDHGDVDHDGERKLFAGDTLIVRVRCYDEAEMRETLAELVGTAHEIVKVPIDTVK